MHRRTVLIALVTAGLIVLACVPAVVTFGLGWLRLGHIQPLGQAFSPEVSSPEAWTLFAVFYLGWMVALTVLLIWTFDRIGHKWHFPEKSARPHKKQLRRARATMRAMEAEQQATIEALRRREAREAQHRKANGAPHGARRVREVQRRDRERRDGGLNGPEKRARRGSGGGAS